MMKVVKRKKKKFNLIRGKVEICNLIDRLPTDDECLKFISTGGFSSASFIGYVAEHARIYNLHVSTFRVGKKEIKFLHDLHKAGKLDKAQFVVFSLAKESDDYSYFKILEKICNDNEWSIKILKNHSKVFLFDTEHGRFVLETSSNLNENPKIERFSFEKDSELYEFYKMNLFDENEEEENKESGEDI